MPQPNDVLPGSSPTPDPVIVPTADAAAVPDPAQPGSKTPPENLLAALHEERRMRGEAEERARIAEEALNPAGDPLVPKGDEWSDEGKAIIEKYVKPLGEQIENLREQSAVKDLIIKFPALKDKQTEFAEYRKGKPNSSLEDVAKLFIVDHNLATAPAPRRKGLEEPRGADRTPLQTGYTPAEIEDLRKNNYVQYQKLLMEGKLSFGSTKS